MQEPATSLARQLLSLARWKQAMLICSIVLMAVGLALPLALPAHASDASSAGSDSSVPDSAATTALALQPDVPVDPASSSESWVSGTLFRLGFGFFIGFSVAFAMRAFIRVTVLVLGFYFLFLFGLEYAGAIEVKWNLLSDRYEDVAAWLSGEFGSFRAFVSGRIPIAGASVTGALIGFTRR